MTNRHSFNCPLESQGIARSSCMVKAGAESAPACRLTLRANGSGTQRLIRSVQLSRPDNCLAVYQSGCNMTCLKCNAWNFTKFATGDWLSAADILNIAQKYEEQVTVWETRDRITAWHAAQLCHSCGHCLEHRTPSAQCPKLIARDQILLSPQGYGPARNIISFTGGDLTCQPAFYAECANLIKTNTRLWVVIETNGYGLSAANLAQLKEAGVDGFGLDIKAFNPKIHRWLTGADNKRILELPRRLHDHGFVFEVLVQFIPGVVGVSDIRKTARLVAEVEPTIPFSIFAFSPEFHLTEYRSPSAAEMNHALSQAQKAGLLNVRLGNTPCSVPAPLGEAAL